MPRRSPSSSRIIAVVAVAEAGEIRVQVAGLRAADLEQERAAGLAGSGGASASTRRRMSVPSAPPS